MVAHPRSDLKTSSTIARLLAQWRSAAAPRGPASIHCALSLSRLRLSTWASLSADTMRTPHAGMDCNTSRTWHLKRDSATPRPPLGNPARNRGHLIFSTWSCSGDHAMLETSQRATVVNSKKTLITTLFNKLFSRTHMCRNLQASKVQMILMKLL